MRVKLLFAAIGAAVLVMSAAGSATAAGTKTICNTEYDNTTLNGGVVVPTGGFCILNNVTVNGGLTEQPFSFAIVNGSTINGAGTSTTPLVPARSVATTSTAG